MKLILLACLIAVGAAMPRPDEDATTLVDERSDSGDGNFNYNIETSNGIFEERTGVPGEKGQSNMNGIFRFTLEDGTVAEIIYIADENGYRPISDLLPTSPPLPAHAIKQIELAEQQGTQQQQRGEPITQEQRGEPITQEQRGEAITFEGESE